MKEVNPDPCHFPVVSPPWGDVFKTQFAESLLEVRFREPGRERVKSLSFLDLYLLGYLHGGGGQKMT